MEAAFTYPFMYWVGMNTAPGTDPDALAEFSRLYSKTHLPEVLAANPGFMRATRYELDRALRHPEPGCPSFCAIYEADEGTTEINRRRRANPVSQPARGAFSSGPPAWEKHDTLWRLVYRRIEL